MLKNFFFLTKLWSIIVGIKTLSGLCWAFTKKSKCHVEFTRWVWVQNSQNDTSLKKSKETVSNCTTIKSHRSCSSTKSCTYIELPKAIQIIALYRYLRFSITCIRRSLNVRTNFISFSNCCTFDFKAYNWSKMYNIVLLSVVEDPATLALNWKVNFWNFSVN